MYLILEFHIKIYILPRIIKLFTAIIKKYTNAKVLNPNNKK